jgi:stage IV sporulation protein FB
MGMVWQDRDYNRGGGAGDYLSNPAAILGLSVPFGNWFGVRVRLHFWLLLTIAFMLASLFHGESILVVALQIGLLLVALLFHDFGHRILAQTVGGQLDEFMLWPMGGMVFPTMPPGPWPMFVGHVGGVLANAILAVGSIVLLHLRGGGWFVPPLDPLANFNIGMYGGITGPYDPVLICLKTFAMINSGLVLGNFLPYYWFDGGYLLQSIFWPFLGGAGALNLTCIIGMILAVPMFALSLVRGDFIGLIFWTLLFMSSYTSRQTMEVVESPTATTGWRSRSWAGRTSHRQAVKRRRQEQKIDAILAKVSAKGMQSLTWWEKRTLRKGSRGMR